MTPLFGDPIGPWFQAFAWLPTHTYDRGWRWLCLIWKRPIQKHYYLDGGADFWWQVRRAKP